MTAVNTLLKGIVGSTAYGLDTPESDVDTLGVFAAPTIAFHGLTKPQESMVTHDPDSTMHEAGKFVRLALNGNPSVNELLWLDQYDFITQLGAELVGIRDAFLCGRQVRDAYIGYARQQLGKLIARGNGSFAADIPERRAAKHARHIIRLLEQGRELYTTGQLTVRLKDPDMVRDLADWILAHPLQGHDYIHGVEMIMDGDGTPLPDHPDRDTAEQWLLRVRNHHYTYDTED